MDSQIMGPTPNKALMVAGKKKEGKTKKGASWGSNPGPLRNLSKTHFREEASENTPS